MKTFIRLEVTDAGDAQVALEVSTQVTTALFYKVLEAKVAPVSTVVEPTFH